jgi:predicted PurR-regulated permease PerM
VAEQQRVPYRTILAAIWLTAASSGLLLLVYELKKVVFDIVLAGFLALVVNPLVVRLEHWKLKRAYAIAITVVAMTVATLGVAALMAAPLATKGAEFARNAPTYIQQVQNRQGPIYKVARRLHLEKQVIKAAPNLSSRLSELSSQILNLGRRMASAAFNAFIVVILAIFMLVEGPSLCEGFLAGIPPGYRPALRRIGATTATVVSGYTSGVLAMAVLNGLVAGGAMAFTHTPFVLPLAVWATVADILPIVGGLLAIVPCALFAFVHSTLAGIVVIVAILVYQQIKNHILYPIMIGRAVKLSSLLVLVSVLAGAELQGIGGAVLAIPVAGMVQAIIHEVGHLRRERNVALAMASQGAGVAAALQHAEEEKAHILVRAAKKVANRQRRRKRHK